MQSNIGLIGLGTMGRAFSRNLASRDFKVSVWNRSTEKITAFVDKYGTEKFYAPSSFEDFIESLEKPRKVILLLPAGNPTEAMVEKLLDQLEAGDGIMDGANQHFKVAESLQGKAFVKGVHFLSCGVSGGEEGALKGPSFMPGGSKESWDLFKTYLLKAAAEDFKGGACASYLGAGAAGQYVKMVHNGIEYAEMQTLAEVYNLLKSLYKLSHEELSEIFERWNQGSLASFLNEISIDILKKKEDGKDLLDLILDKAGQKGTGRWTSEEALALGVPTPSITGAVFMRAFSANKSQRVLLETQYQDENAQTLTPNLTVQRFVEKCERALLASRLSNFEQGFQLLKEADKIYEFGLNFSEITRVWQGGCIIRNKWLKEMQEFFSQTHSSTNTSSSASSPSLYTAPFAQEILRESEEAWSEVIQIAAKHQIPTLALSGALTHFLASKQGRGSANFIQGLRDRFGSHTYERIDKDGSHHSNWSS
jgi:6-phosphogluconate dehydrogenase